MKEYSTDGYRHPIYFVDLITQEILPVQWVPKELNYSSETTLVQIASPGRNNPLYHFGGSDDTLSFEFTWLATEANRADVIRKCRWLEARTKANGYKEGIHPVLFLWGSVLMETQNSEAWLIEKADYKLSQFNGSKSLLPEIATQSITLKRITDNNRLMEEIAYMGEPDEFVTDINPDEVALNFFNNQKNIRPQIPGQSAELQTAIPSYLTDPRYSKRNLAREKGLLIAQTAISYFLNNPVGRVTQQAGAKAGEFQSLNKNFPKLK
jgi:hypothetical protein